METKKRYLLAILSLLVSVDPVFAIEAIESGEDSNILSQFFDKNFFLIFSLLSCVSLSSLLSMIHMDSIRVSFLQKQYEELIPKKLEELYKTSIEYKIDCQPSNVQKQRIEAIEKEINRLTRENDVLNEKLSNDAQGGQNV
ncbi:MAG: hypothetical protein HQL05_15650 [Nitrospirae bacterium]|nr:hypothetical protein [Nitrospirota bacterium]